MKKIKVQKHQLQLIVFFSLGLYFLPFSMWAENVNYITNRSPLIEVPFTALPIGTVKADGWLLNQLQLQKDGLTGNAESIYSSATELGAGSDWLGGTGVSWEIPPYYTKGMVALAYTLGDVNLITKVSKWINWSINSQKANGFFGPSNDKDWWDRMPMLYAIRDFYDATNDSRVIPFFTKYFQYQNNTLNSQPLTMWGKSRAGDNIEIIFWLYNRTGDVFLLTLADKIKNQAYDWTDIFTNNRFMSFQADFQPKHNVNVAEAMKMPAIYYQKSLTATDKDAYNHGLDHLMRDHGQPEGMQSGNEMIGGKSAMTGLEMCSIVEQMQSCETAQMILGDATIGDQLEKVAFNALPGGMAKDIKGTQYYTQANQVKSKFGNSNFGQNYDNGLLPGAMSGYPCCRFNFHMGWPYFVKTMWAATNDNGLAAMAYGPSHLTAKVGNGVDVTIVEATDYPFAEQLNFTITTGQEVAFPLKLRLPAWCSNPQIEVNGVLQSGTENGGFYSINRTWSNNDVVILKLPMTIKLNDELNNAVSVQRGPLVYSLKISEKWVARTDYGNDFKEYEVTPLSSWNYGLVLDKTNPEASIQVNKGVMPVNPFIQGTTPVTLTVSAKKVPSWGYALNGNFATDPPYGPVETTEATEQVTLVPFGAENLRVTCLPLVGIPDFATTTFQDDFSTGNQIGWVNYNGSFLVDNGEYFATNTEMYFCSKSIQSSTLFSDFTYDASVKVGTSGDGGLMFRASKLSMGADEYNGYYFCLSGSAQNVVLGKHNGTWTPQVIVPMTIVANTWYQVRVVAKGSNFKIYVNDMTTPKVNFNDASFASGAIGVRSYNSITRWDNLSVTSSIVSGVKDIKTSEAIRVYPNPAKDYLDVSFGKELASEYTVDVISMNGVLLQTKNRSNNESLIQVDTKKLVPAIYVLNIHSKTDSFQYRFIKE
ncbi:MAG TPA: beta-L-arabinofuranosidase domain-containing protein [Paludibacter sp.]